MLEQINKENFKHMLAQFSTPELEGMIEKFPYFQQAHLLLAKKYQQENSPKFDQQLQLAALYIQDRELLYSLFNEKAGLAVKSSGLTAPDVIVQTTSIAKEGMKAEDLPVVKEKITATNQPAADLVVDDSDLTLHLEQILKSAKEISLLAESTIEKKPEVIFETLKAEEPKIEAIAETIPEETHAEVIEELDLTVEKQEIVIELPQPEEEYPKLEAIAETLPEETEEELTEEMSPVDEKPLEVFSRIQPHTFDEWLKAFNNKSTTEITEPPVVAEDKAGEEDDELNQLLAVNISVDYLHELVKEETTYAKGLERFIEAQIQKHKQPEIKKAPPEKAINTDPATETMAKVYEMQKKYSKAIKTYEALTLKFPEKSSLFAARINYLKNII